MAKIPILEFEISLRAESKIWEHRITRRQIHELLGNRWIVVRNRKNRAADYVVIGRDDNGRCITVPILPTESPTIWRPVTAWYCKQGEAARLR
jgi:hypothetical protein